MLELQHINKRIGDRQILKDLSLTIPDHAITVIVGPSGAGKTTLLRCISGLSALDSGKLLLDGEPFDPHQRPADRRAIGVVFQDFQLFPNLTVLGNITLAPTLALKLRPAEAEQKAQTLLEKLNISNLRQLYPYALSGGQKQRVALARALAMKPRLICYDEPTSALDSGLRGRVAALLLSLKAEGITQIVVTHDQDFAKTIADHMINVVPIAG